MSRKNKKGDKVPQGLLEKEDMQEYGQVVKILGNCQFKIKLNGTNKEVSGRLRGTLRKRKSSHRLEVNSVVLVCYRDYQDNIVDIIHVYNDNDRRNLVKKGVITFEEKDEEKEQDLPFEFDFEQI